MARLDRKSGRFNVVYESDEIDGALEGYQGVYGQEIAYYRYSRAESSFHPVYGEAAGTGRVFYTPVDVPVLQVIREEGAADQREAGLYWTDSIHVIASFGHLSKTGLTELDIAHGSYLNDRMAYDGRIFRVTAIHVLGQIRRRDFIVSIDATQLKREDLINDPAFSNWWSSEQVPDPIPGEVCMPNVVESFTFVQSMPSNVWTIDHMLGFNPNVAVEDVDGNEIDAAVTWPTVNRVVCSFAASISGKAHLS
ncbi:hypothetical protein AB0K16_22565 [Nonomuraea jabiensis]|uniref:hypothetical protein n=1 Tax=Nonomuraea jabiensis TaxID=882448 RepID=UPI00343CF830